MSFDVALAKFERKKYEKLLKARKVEESRLMSEGRESEIASLPEIYNRKAEKVRPTYRYRIAKLLDIK